MDHSRRDVSCSTFGRYPYSTPEVAVIRKLGGSNWEDTGHDAGGTSRTRATVASSTRARL